MKSMNLFFPLDLIGEFSSCSCKSFEDLLPQAGLAISFNFFILSTRRVKPLPTDGAPRLDRFFGWPCQFETDEPSLNQSHLRSMWELHKQRH